MPEPRLLPVPMFADNYLWLYHTDDDEALAVDPGDYAVLDRALQAGNLRLTTVFVTHHHADHCGGLDELRQSRPGVRVYGPEGIRGVSRTVSDGQILDLGTLGRWHVMAVPGHTLDHLAFHADEPGILFCGDTLFSAGCGRLFEGDAAMLHQSLQRLANLPDRTRVCCAHEYTLSNLRFACEVDPDNEALAAYRRTCEHRRQVGEPTLPASLGAEKRINPFLRCASPAIQAGLSARPDGPAPGKEPVEFFAALRRLKDVWKPVSP